MLNFYIKNALITAVIVSVSGAIIFPDTDFRLHILALFVIPVILLLVQEEDGGLKKRSDGGVTLDIDYLVGDGLVKIFGTSILSTVFAIPLSYIIGLF